jgi:hypothetical protein
MGRPAHEASELFRRQVEAMAGYGVPEADIARVIGIDAKTLRKHYRGELSTGSIKATAKVAEFLYRKATTEGPQCVTAAIFWLKTRGDWKETSVQEITGPPPRLIVSWNSSPAGDPPTEKRLPATGPMH